VIILKKYIELTILSIILVGILSGFQKSAVLPLVGEYSESTPSLSVQSRTKGNNVFVECVLSGISFRQSEQNDRKVGKLVIWLDGKRTKEVNSAAFIIKGLPPGEHSVKLEVVDLKNVPYGVTKEFLVNIPK
jgi:FlaG/FlaF family flagellin (archaellin)